MFLPFRGGGREGYVADGACFIRLKAASYFVDNAI